MSLSTLILRKAHIDANVAKLPLLPAIRTDLRLRPRASVGNVTAVSACRFPCPGSHARGTELAAAGAFRGGRPQRRVRRPVPLLGEHPLARRLTRCTVPVGSKINQAPPADVRGWRRLPPFPPELHRQEGGDAPTAYLGLPTLGVTFNYKYPPPPFVLSEEIRALKRPSQSLEWKLCPDSSIGGGKYEVLRTCFCFWRKPPSRLLLGVGCHIAVRDCKKCTLGGEAVSA